MAGILTFLLQIAIVQIKSTSVDFSFIELRQFSKMLRKCNCEHVNIAFAPIQ